MQFGKRWLNLGQMQHLWLFGSTTDTSVNGERSRNTLNLIANPPNWVDLNRLCNKPLRLVV